MSWFVEFIAKDKASALDEIAAQFLRNVFPNEIKIFLISLVESLSVLDGYVIYLYSTGHLGIPTSQHNQSANDETKVKIIKLV